jgi:hypothetical protein
MSKQSEEIEKIEKQVEDSGYLDGVNVPALFSAMLPAETITFKIGECPQESTFSLRKMNADQWMQFQGLCGGRAAADGSFIPANMADCQHALLKGTVIGAEIYFLNEKGETQQYPFPKDGPARDKFFKDLEPSLAMRLFQNAMRVNGAHPN